MSRTNRISPDTRELLEAVAAALTLPPAAPHAWEDRRQLLADRAMHVRGVMDAAASPGATLVSLAEQLRQIDADPMLAAAYQTATEKAVTR